MSFYRRCARSLIDLKAVDGLDFLSESKFYTIFLHPGGALHLFYLLLFPYKTNQLISNNIYKDNRLFGCVSTMINFVLDLSTQDCEQKDSKVAYLASEQLNSEHLNG